MVPPIKLLHGFPIASELLPKGVGDLAALDLWQVTDLRPSLSLADSISLP